MEKVENAPKKTDFTDFKVKYFEANELIQRKYPVVYGTIHSFFIIIIALIIIFIEIMIGMQSTFLSQIVDASINGGITLGIFYIMTAIVQLFLGKFGLFFFFVAA
jgi:hypothetical protein